MSGVPLRYLHPGLRGSARPVFSQQQMKLTAENLKEECREGGKETVP